MLLPFLGKVAVFALQIHARDNAAHFPILAAARTSEEALDLLMPRYTVDTGSFICPGSKQPSLTGSESLSSKKSSYAYYMGHRAAEASQG